MTVCKTCLAKFNQKKCPVDQTAISHNYDELPVNYALLQLVGIAVPNEVELPIVKQLGCHIDSYKEVKKNIEELALFLKPQLGMLHKANSNDSILSFGLLCIYFERIQFK